MQKTFERLNLTIKGDDRRKANRCTLPKIKHTALVASQDNNELTQNMDHQEALIYHIPEIVLRRKWKPDRPHITQYVSQSQKSDSQATYAKYMREIKLSAQIARVSGRYPNRSVPKPLRFKIILPSQQKKIKHDTSADGHHPAQ